MATLLQKIQKFTTCKNYSKNMCKTKKNKYVGNFKQPPHSFYFIPRRISVQKLNALQVKGVINHIQWEMTPMVFHLF